MSDALRELIARNRAGGEAALPAVCSAHPEVLRAALMLAEELDRPLIVEATSNQVNQDGGYTGMRPAEFPGFLRGLAREVGCDADRVILGGDHLGPQAWRSEPPESAMEKARALVAGYAAAGFTKIHLDCAEGCAGEPERPDPGLCAARAAELARVAAGAAPDPDALAFVVGTEVPPPGGAREGELRVEITRPEDARATMDAHVDAFGDLANRIVGLVVQPGVEFSAREVHHLPEEADSELAALRAVLGEYDGLCFEAHSTDYQRPEAYRRLARAGFAVLKVGPALTFAYREAIYALDMLVDILDGPSRRCPSVREAAEAAMLADPSHWEGHYQGTEEEVRLLRHWGYSDRIRYYWADPALARVTTSLLDSLHGECTLQSVLSQLLRGAVLDRAEILATRSGLVGQTYTVVIAAIQGTLVMID